MKLDKKFKQVRRNMLMMSELPLVAHADRNFLQEETHLQLTPSGGGINESMACKLEKCKFQERGENRDYNSETNKTKKQLCV